MKTIRDRLTLRLLLVWSVLLISAGLVVYTNLRTSLINQFDNTLRAKAAAVMTAVELVGGSVVVDYSDGFMREFDTNGTAYFEIFCEDGRIERSRSFRGERASNRSFLVPELGIQLAKIHELNGVPDSIWEENHGNGYQSPTLFWNDGNLPSGFPSRTITVPFVLQSDKEEDRIKGSHMLAGLVIAGDRRELDQSLSNVARSLRAGGISLIGITGVLLPWLLRRELAPLNRLGEQSQRITAETLAERFPTAGLPAELAPISGRLNDLLQRLQTSFERERQFSDDLAQEFRTPIAELRSLAELSLKWPDARGADADRNVLAVALQMEAIITRLLAMARSSEGRLPLEIQPVPVATLVSSVLQPLQARMKARQLFAEVSLPPSLEIETDPSLLRSILANLLENAVEYSAPGGTVRIQSKAESDQFVLQIMNPAEQLGPQDLPHLFERFWRKDKARSGGEHCGLGLPLARTFAGSLGMTLEASLDNEGRLTMTLAGPVEAAARKNLTSQETKTVTPKETNT